MRQPIQTILTSTESDQMFLAVEYALRAAKKDGCPVAIARMQKAYDMFVNHPVMGGWDTEDERNAAFTQGIATDCITWGTN